jgi:hypothetical protein
MVSPLLLRRVLMVITSSEQMWLEEVGYSLIVPQRLDKLGPTHATVVVAVHPIKQQAQVQDCL